MREELVTLRSHVNVLWEASEKKQTGTKTRRHKAVTAINELLSKKSVIRTLTYASRVEMMKGTKQDEDPENVVLAWAELTSILVDAVDKACAEAKNAKSVSKSGLASLRPEYMVTVRSVITKAIRFGPSGVIRHITPVFLCLSHQWLAEPSLRSIIADQVWQLVKDILEDEANRAMLTPKYIRLWVDVCFEQLTGRGPLQRKSQVISSIASRVFELLSKPVSSFDTLTQGSRGVSTSKMLGGDYSYAMICERCCLMLVIADSMPRRDARELQATSFRILTQVLQNHAVSFTGSSALSSIINVSMKPLLSCWTDRRYHNQAVSLAGVLIFLAPNHRELSDALRRRILADLKDRSSSVILSSGYDVKDNFVRTAAQCFSLATCLDLVKSSLKQKGHTILWLRVVQSITSRKVLKIGTSVLVNRKELHDQMTDLISTITDILKNKLPVRDSKYGELIRWLSRAVQAACMLVQKLGESQDVGWDRRMWESVYQELWNHASRAKSEVPSRIEFCTNDVTENWYESLVSTLVTIHYSFLLDSPPGGLPRTVDGDSGRLQYPFSRITGDCARTSCLELEYIRNVIAKNGLPEHIGPRLRERMLDRLLAGCEIENLQCEHSSERLIHSSCAVLGLSRGACLMFERPGHSELRNSGEKRPDMNSMYYLNCFFSMNMDKNCISGDGRQLCVELKESMYMWKDSPPGICNPLFCFPVSDGTSMDSLPKRKFEIQIGHGTHFSVDPRTTSVLESMLLSMIQNSLRKSTQPSNYSHDDAPACDDQNDVEASCEKSSEDGFKSELSTVCGIKWILVLSNYFLQGLKLGVIMSNSDTSEQESNTLKGLKSLLILLLGKLSKTGSILLVAQSQLSESMISILTSLMRLIESKSKRETLSKTEFGFVLLGETILQTIVSISRNLGELIVNVVETKTDETIKIIQSDDCISSLSFKRRRIGESSAPKRRRVSTGPGLRGDHRVSDEESWGEIDKNREGKDIDDECDSSEDSNEFIQRPAPSSTITSSPKYNLSHFSKLFSTSAIHNATRVLRCIIIHNPRVAKDLIEIFQEGLKAINDIQLMLSPDGFERSCLLSDVSDTSFLEMRKCIWSILFSLGTYPALLAVGEDICKTGNMWEEAEEASHRYVHLYAKSFGIQERNHYPVMQMLEVARIVYLEFSRIFILRCGEDKMLDRLKHHRENAHCMLPKLLSRIMKTVDHFRSKHAFRMPRGVRASYLRTGLAFMETMSKCFESFVNASQIGTVVSDVSKLLNSTKKAVLKFLSDPDGSVRVLAAQLIPRLLNVLHFKTITDMETFMKGFLPATSSCLDDSAPYVLQNPEDLSRDTEEQARALWDLSKHEHIAHTSIPDSFLNVGSTSKGYTSIISLTEAAIARDALVPFFYVELFQRVSENPGLRAAAYFAIIRLCGTRGHESPKCLFQVFSRIILHRWLCSRNTVDRLHEFPVCLLLDYNHHDEGVNCDWIRAHQSVLIPYFLVHESLGDLPRLDLTSKLANDLGTSTSQLLSTNVPSFSLIYPMHFIDSMHERAHMLWSAIDSCVEGRLRILMRENNESVVSVLLRSIHTKAEENTSPHDHVKNIESSLGFVRDTTKLKPPLYDPLVIALSVNQLYKASSDVFIMSGIVLNGSIFAEVRMEKTGKVIAGDFSAFAEECQRKNGTLLHILLTISRFLVGAPQHQPAQNRRDAFFCVGVMWRMMSTLLLTKSLSERNNFYLLIARGFEHPETISDAAWLLFDVQNRVSKINSEYPSFSISETELSSDPNMSEQLSQMSSSQERGLYELLKAVSPVLVSLLVSSDAIIPEHQKAIASNALKRLVSLCDRLKAWSVILANGPFPTHKRLAHVQRIYIAAKNETDAQFRKARLEKALGALNRFGGIFKLQTSLASPVFLASLQELNSELNDKVLSDLSRRLKAEAWVRSCGMEYMTAPRVSDVISYAIEFTRVTNQDEEVCFDKLDNSYLTVHSFPQGDSPDEELRNAILLESAKLLSKLGLLNLYSTPISSTPNYHRNIPARALFGKYEDVGSGTQMSMFLLRDILSSGAPIRALTAFETLKTILRTKDGRSILAANDDRLKAISFLCEGNRGADLIRKEPSAILLDPRSGDEVSVEELPDILEVRLWSCISNDFTHQSGLEKWVRTFSAAFARACRSKEMQALSSICFASYEVSCQMMPYILMDTICDLDTKRLSIVSDLLRIHVLSNTKTPVVLRRLFVHALDVLCQIGLAVAFKDGVSHWFQHTDKTYPCYYIFEIPYEEVASAALSSKAYFSSIRFAQLHISQKEIHLELCRSSKTKKENSTNLDGNAFLEEELEQARAQVRPLVHEAMIHISEPDSRTAFYSGKDLKTLVANIATFNNEWASALGALEVPMEQDYYGYGVMNSEEQVFRYGSTGNELSIDLNREIQKFKCFAGLGTLKIACAYWEELRRRVAAMSRGHNNFSSPKQCALIDQLNEMRYAAAWKLQQWEPPKKLNPGKCLVSRTTSGEGFHESIYNILHSIRTKRYGDVFDTLSKARSSLLTSLVANTASVSAPAVQRLAAKLRVLEFLDRLTSAKCAPSPTVNAPFVMQGRIDESISVRIEDNELPLEKNIPFPIQDRKSQDNESASQVVDHGPLAETELLFRLLNTEAPADQDGFFPLLKAFDANILTMEIPAVLFSCLGIKSDIALAAAASSALVFSEGGVGCWARAASCLGTMQTAFLQDAERSKSVAWKLQDARLRWYSNHDACCRRQALDGVKSILTNDLYGKHGERRSDDKSDVEMKYQCIVWSPRVKVDPLLQFLRVEACCLAAKWSLDMRTHEPMDLYRLYLESGLAAAQHTPGNRKLTARAHLAMASFSNEQIKNIDLYRKSRTYEEMRLALKAAEDKVERMKEAKEGGLVTEKGVEVRRRSRSFRSQITSGNKLSRELDGLIYYEQRKARIERERLEKLNHAHRKWQLLACKHFAACLRAETNQDLKVAFRMVAIWLDSGAMRDAISAALLSSPAISGNKCIDVPVSKLLPLAPQLISRLNISESLGPNLFQSTLAGTIISMASDFPAHCLWQLLALTNSTRVCATEEKYSAFYKGDKDKKEAAEEILKRLQQNHGSTVSEMKTVSDAYILLSEIDHDAKQQGKRLDMKSYSLKRLGKLTNVPVPTIPLPICSEDHLEALPYIHSFERYATVCAGLSRPLSIICIGSDGHRYPQLVKGKDDLRGDAVMEQMFMIVNKLLQGDGRAATRSLSIRTYRIVPLSPFSGIMQFVENTMQLKDVLVEKSVSGKRVFRKSLHERYRPKDLKHVVIQERAFKEYKHEGRRDIQRVKKYLRSAWPKFQPVFRHFFVEQWPDPEEWFQHQLNYSRSVAVMSIVGFILGLGDRHLSNILMDVRTAEVVHIDFGVAFEQGKLLPTPELMPFRLTRDIVDGLGIAGVEGVFRRSCEVTMQVLRQNKDVLLTVIDVLLHDPMFTWALTPIEVLKEQNALEVGSLNLYEDGESSRSLPESAVDAVARKVDRDLNGSRDAQRAMSRISEKLDGLEGTERLSVEAHVARLIDEARAFHVLGAVFPGWSPWV